MSEEKIENKKMIEVGDIFIDEKHGIGLPSICYCAKISKSWFRRKKPFGFLHTFHEGIPCKNQSITWCSEEEVKQLLELSKQKNSKIAYVSKSKKVNLQV